MAAQLDASSDSTYQTADSSYSWNHTCAGTNRLLIVGVSMLSVAGSSVSGITYNGVAMVFVGEEHSATGAIRSEVWKLVAPATGTHAIAVTLSASLDSVGTASSWTNANQENPLDYNVSGQIYYFSTSNTNVGAATANATVITEQDQDIQLGITATNDTAPDTSYPATDTSVVSGTLGTGIMSYDGPWSPGSRSFTPALIAALKTWALIIVAIRQADPVNAAMWHPQYPDQLNPAKRPAFLQAFQGPILPPPNIPDQPSEHPQFGGQQIVRRYRPMGY